MDQSKYFYRAAVYTEAGGNVALADINNPKQTTPLDPWFGVVIQLADGRHTLGELLRCIEQRFAGHPPAKLKEMLTSVVDRMVDDKLIVVTEGPVALPYYLSQPVEYLDIARAQKEMAEEAEAVQ